MADALNILGKAKKVKLPPGWVEKFSKKHPDRPFYFNEITGESRWSPPVDPSEEVMHKGKKRKNCDEESEEFSDSTITAADQLLNAITSNRPKLKAKTKTPVDKKKECNNDTPQMKLLREKVAQRKAEQEAKKSKSVNRKQSQQNVSASKENDSESLPSTPQSKKRSQRSSSIISSNESVTSDCSTVSNASSMGTKIKATAITMSKSPSKAINFSINQQPTITKLPRIPKVQPDRKNQETSKAPDDEAISNKIVDESNKDEMNNISNTRKTPQKNLANKRLEDFRKSLSSEREKGVKRLRQSLSNNNNNNKTSAKDKSKLLCTPPPVLYKKAQTRLHSLEKRIQNNGMLVINQANGMKIDEEEIMKEKRVLEKIENEFCENMDWEPIEDEKIMSEIHSIRFQLDDKSNEKLSELSCNALQSVDNSGETRALYIVIDTNVFVSNLPFVEEVRDSSSDIFGRPFIVIPWTVLQELDFIKDDKTNGRPQALKLKARKAVDFLNRHFSSKHPRFLGQTPAEVERNKEKFMIECPDDKILQTCLQIKESKKSPVLLSYDKNLCSKAIIHDIPTLCKDEPLEKIYYLKAAENTEFLSNSLHAQLEENEEEVNVMQKELLEAEDIMEEGKAVLKSLLSEVVAKEMEILFGSRWEMHVIIRPPWSVLQVLKCAIKHWMAAVSESFLRKAEPMLRDLQDCINNIPQGGRKLKDVKFFLEKCNDLVQTLNATKYPTFKQEMLKQLDDLQKRCLSTIEEIKNSRFKEVVGDEEDPCEVEKRAALAFTVMENIYSFARDACGIAADALGLQCSFSYNKMHPFLTPELALQHQQNISISVNSLLQVLRSVLSKMDKDLQSDDKVVFDLHQILSNFNGELNFEEHSKLSPLDVFCCIKLKKPKLEKGYEQLQELAVHFCRMANYQCT